MIDRPSDGFTFDELREEYDWMSDFMGRMAERIRGNADVRSLAAYVGKLEAENAKLRELVREVWFYAEQELVCDDNCPYGASCDWKDCVFTRRMRELGVEVTS